MPNEYIERVIAECKRRLAERLASGSIFGSLQETCEFHLKCADEKLLRASSEALTDFGKMTLLLMAVEDIQFVDGILSGNSLLTVPCGGKA